MAFWIHGLDPALFARWFTLSDHELAAHGALRTIADASPGYPCRVSLADADPGDELLLLPFEHHPTSSPYRAAGPIYVRRSAQTRLVLDRVPDVLERRVLSVRGYDAAGMMAAADLVDGRELASKLDAVLGRAEVAYVHVHYAKPGCFACSVTRPS
jgi:hypothetical protein